MPLPLSTKARRFFLPVSFRSREKSYMISTSCLSRRSLWNAVALVVTGMRAGSLQLSNINILELHQAGRTAPGALLVLPAMMLEGEASAGGKIGNGGPGN